ncbi:UNVERIFIED_CONTAM: Chromosome transmission fidelity protein 8 [Sesamum latifolium]|uniref:Chromosome transmission fidelity protein 8 n=1 Tax=Sesamum latifolium TaxID=2727402 RepID=A0AAW2T7B5_9LAMI
MQIKVKCSCGEGNCPEWAIVELQGVVEAQPSFENRLQNLQIGVLCRPSSQENYTFTVGYHELTGTKVSLKKPILVLKKIKLRKEEEEEGEDDVNSAGVELDVIGVIRHKILFKTRPKALISSKDTSDVCKNLSINIPFALYLKHHFARNAISLSYTRWNLHGNVCSENPRLAVDDARFMFNNLNSTSTCCQGKSQCTHGAALIGSSCVSDEPDGCEL